MSIPTHLQYTSQHEWISTKENHITIGISDYAQDALGEIVHVELPEIGALFQQGDSVCEVESVKSVSDVYTPFSGKVIQVNDALEDSPETVNEDPYQKGWLVQLERTDLSETGELLSASDYQSLTES